MQDELRAVLGLAERAAPKAGFFDLGMDSPMAVEFRNRIVAVLGDSYRVNNILAFDYPSVEKLARHLALELGAAAYALEVGAQKDQESRLKSERKRLEDKGEDGVLQEVSGLLEDLT